MLAKKTLRTLPSLSLTIIASALTISTTLPENCLSLALN